MLKIVKTRTLSIEQKAIILAIISLILAGISDKYLIVNHIIH